MFELWLSSGKRARLRSYITVDMADMLGSTDNNRIVEYKTK